MSVAFYWRLHRIKPTNLGDDMNIRYMAVALTFVGSLGLTQVASAQSVRIYTQKVSAKKICGTYYAKFRCSTTEAHMKLNVADIALQIDGKNSPRHAQVLGQIYTGLSGVPAFFDPCGTLSHADFGNRSAATNFNYRKRASSELGASTSIDVKSALVAAGVPSNQLDVLQAEFEATYGKKAKAEYNLTGRYYRLGIDSLKLQQIRGVSPASAGLKACGDTLRANYEKKLIYSIAVVELNKATFVSDVASDIALSFAAKVKQKHQNADIAGLSLSVKSRIEVSLSISMEPEWRVISWDYLRLGSPVTKS